MSNRRMKSEKARSLGRHAFVFGVRQRAAEIFEVDKARYFKSPLEIALKLWYTYFANVLIYFS